MGGQSRYRVQTVREAVTRVTSLRRGEGVRRRDTTGEGDCDCTVRSHIQRQMDVRFLGEVSHLELPEHLQKYLVTYSGKMFFSYLRSKLWSFIWGAFFFSFHVLTNSHRFALLRLKTVSLHSDYTVATRTSSGCATKHSGQISPTNKKPGMPSTVIIIA